MKEITILIITISFLQKSLGTFIVALSNDNSDDLEKNELNFSAILEENKKYNKFENYCPLNISGRADADITKVPYQVALRQKTSFALWDAFCTGSLITFRFVLTSAECFIDSEYNRKLNLVQVAAGTTRKTMSILSKVKEHLREIKRFYKHKFYDEDSMKHNMGIIELYRDFNECNEIKPIRMHLLNVDKNLQVNEQCLMSGYGHTTTIGHFNHLQMICMPMLSRKKCKKLIHKKYFHESTACTRKKGIGGCKGDEGGPIVCQGVLVAIISWAYKCGKGTIVLTKISSYTSNPNDVAFEESKSCQPVCSVLLYTLCIFVKAFNN